MMLLRTLLQSCPACISPGPAAASSFPREQDNSSQLWRPRCVSHLHKIFLPSPYTFFSVSSSSVREPKRLETESWMFFPPSPPNAEVGRSLTRPAGFSMKLLQGSVGSLPSVFGSSSVLLSHRAGHRDAVQKVFGFHQSKIDEGGWHSPRASPGSSAPP